ncbi:hypothetical protein ASAP_1846 [Asaia bogorensis]|uniref:Uncharacterized protein n=1 Tax=Asaia bogorensis TaxID=91915 RepID=A0A060QKH0_9PROT|nr:hypothetical protein ASAP_1846 [Asaia bogorensis]
MFCWSGAHASSQYGLTDHANHFSKGAPGSCHSWYEVIEHRPDASTSSRS